ncbi:heparan sulfate glucosamine 3-O-sulfotransferase 1-like [Lytechinus variegatus]|uniref:heparan sulfate glucosamine 3-O-sulfotransferase 1-like n=1 Tax=Lytechinus variegatus TaxID=7654 RepID=UPI001BB1698F|nr:heparan sulfate glucosamine 3-O-sulfotransferase 1-like [Lytechinus variegatus]
MTTKSVYLKSTCAGFLLGLSLPVVIYLFYQSSENERFLLPRPSVVEGTTSGQSSVKKTSSAVTQKDEYEASSIFSKGDDNLFMAEQERKVSIKNPADGLTNCPKNSDRATVRRLNCRQRLPNVIGLGVQKCGTGALAFFLASHPNIAHAKPAEVHFWTKYPDRGLGWYKKQMPISSKYQLTMEKSPSYWRVEGVPQMMKRKMPPETKFIVAIRDPVIRAVSGYLHELLTGTASRFIDRPLQPGKPVKVHTFLNDTFESTVIRPDGKLMYYNSIIDNGIYVKRFQDWLSVFPRDHFLVVDGSELTANPLPVLQEVEVFLGLPKYFDESKVYFNASKGFYCLHDEKKECMGQGKGRKHPEMSAELEQRLREFYHPYNLEMEKLVGRTFSWA